MDNLYRVQAASPELAALMRRLKTIYAITGGEVPKNANGKKDGFNEKKSSLIMQLSNFDKVRRDGGCPRARRARMPPLPTAAAALTTPPALPSARAPPLPAQLLDSRDHSGLATDSRDFIRLKLTINGELTKLEAQVKDLVDSNKKEVEKKKCAAVGEGAPRGMPRASRARLARALTPPAPSHPPSPLPPATSSRATRSRRATR